MTADDRRPAAGNGPDRPQARWFLAIALIGALAGAAAPWLSNGQIGWGIVGGAIGLALGGGIKAVRRRRSDNA